MPYLVTVEVLLHTPDAPDADAARARALRKVTALLEEERPKWKVGEVTQVVDLATAHVEPSGE